MPVGITAIYRYVEGAFRLFDPRTENDKAKFPRFLLEQPCPWAGKFFRELPPEIQDGLRETTLLLAMIQSDDGYLPGSCIPARCHISSKRLFRFRRDLDSQSIFYSDLLIKPPFYLRPFVTGVAEL